MTEFLRLRWRKLASWRSFSDTDWWNEYDAAIGAESSRRGNTYEVYTYGQLIATCHSLDDAKEVVESVYGRLDWKKVELPLVTVEHNYFGEMDDFTDPRVIYTVDTLPKLGVN